MTPDPLRAVAERLARDVVDEYASKRSSALLHRWDACASEHRERSISLVLAGLTHAARSADRTAEREAARKAWDAAARFTEDECKMPSPESFARTRDRYLAAEFDAGERVALSDGSVVTLSGCGKYLVVTAHSEPPRTWRVDQWRHVPHTGADFDAVKRLAEQRGAER